MVKIYGHSDDLVEIEGSAYHDDEIGCFSSDVRIWFADGTVILVSYGKGELAVWQIIVEEKGTAEQKLEECFDEDADLYSDVFYIEAEVSTHEVIDR